MSKVKVKTLKPFDMFDGNGLHAVAEEFAVDVGTFGELEANGLVERVGDEAEPKTRRKAKAAEAEAEPDDEPADIVETVDEPAAEPADEPAEGPKSRRKARTDEDE